MKRNLLALSVVGTVLATSAALVGMAQQSDQVPSPVIRVTTRLVMVDVIAVDKSGKPVTDLKPEDFVVEESGKKQKIAVFGLQNPPAAAAALPALPPGVYSNRPEAQVAPGPVTILLIDGLNSPFQNQAFVRQKLIEYVRTQHQPGQRMAVLALGNGLFKLQGFTSDPALLRAAMENYRPQAVRETAASQIEQRVTSVPPANIGLRGTSGETRVSALLSTLSFFENEQEVLALDVRMRTTLESLRAIARMVSGMPGRKNLVWVSARFPFSLTPEDAAVTFTPTRANDPTAPPPTAQENTQFAYQQQVRQGEVENIRRTAALLADSQVAVYPVDARGLIGAQQLADASRSGLNPSGLLRMGHEYGTQVSNVGASITSNQGVMQDLAQQTGGRPYYNRNDIDNAVAVATADGGTFYDIGYYPDKKKFDGGFRKIKVTVTRPNVELRYRRGYYAVDPTKVDAKQRDAEMNTMLLRDSGEATLVTFDVQVSPAKGKVTVHFLVPARSFSTEEAAAGRRVNLDFFLAALTRDGKKVVANTGQTVDATLNPDQFAQVQQQGLVVPIEATLPAGELELRLAVRDNRTGYFGTLNAPVTVKP
ncbi:MAG: VWA domain-containing protein [Terriglobales bacterium]